MKVKVDKIPPQILAIRIVEMLNRYAKLRPDANIRINTPHGIAFCKLSEATNYTTDYNDIVIDADNEGFKV